MKALVIGGTGFLGGAIVEAALRGGFVVDVLTRQQLNSDNQFLNYICGDRYKNRTSDCSGQRYAPWRLNYQFII